MNPQTSENDSFESQYEEFCRGAGSQPCTCYYPDHRDVTLFELSTDDVTKSATERANGTGPASCEDLGKMGYSLNGFYMIRFSPQRVKAAFCIFNNKMIENSLLSQVSPSKSSNKPLKTAKKLKYCGGMKNQPCTFYYSDYPDSKLSEVNSVNIIASQPNTIIQPKNCKDLQLIGHFLKGFYLVRFNAVKVKIVYCNFNQEIEPKISNTCKAIGSQPCSCYYLSKSSNILQFELSSDALTQHILKENNNGTSAPPGPKSCKDLQNLGHNLNGFYMVGIHIKLVQTVYCKFDIKSKEDTTNLPTLKSPTMTPLSNTVPNFSFRPLCGNAMIGFFKNNHGKCLSISTLEGNIQNEFGNAVVIQSNCNQHDERQIWKYCKRHLLHNYLDKCLVFLTDDEKSINKSSSRVIIRNCNLEENRQTWYWLRTKEFQNSEKCLSVVDNSGLHGAELNMDKCDLNKEGQIWSFSTKERLHMFN